MSGSIRVLVAATGAAGHAFPAFALAKELDARGHATLIVGDERWRAPIEGEGLAFTAMPEYSFLGYPPDRDAYPSVAEVAGRLARVVGEFAPDVAVNDVYTVAAALAAELEGVCSATLIPYHYPVSAPGLPFFAGLGVQPLGLMPPRTRAGVAAWRALRPLHERHLRREYAEVDRARGELGLPPRPGPAPPIGGELVLVATLPELEHPREWPPHVHVTGPMFFEPPGLEAEVPGNRDPLVLVAPSTHADVGLRLISVALEALAAEPVRVLASINERGRIWEGPLPANATVVDWVSYQRTLPRTALVVCHGGHGTVARAITAGLPVLVCPAWGDQADNGARVSRAGAGLTIPRRLLGPRAVRVATRTLLGDERFAARAREIAAAHQPGEGPRRGADLVEALAAAQPR